jgi:hypothetical protein
MLEPKFEVFETTEDLVNLDKPYRHIMVEGVKYRASSNSCKGVTLFYNEETGKAYFRYELMVHDGENLRLWNEKNLPREMEIAIDFQFKVV